MEDAPTIATAEGTQEEQQPRNRRERRIKAVMDKRKDSPFWKNKRTKYFMRVLGMRPLKKRTGYCRLCGDGIYRGQRTQDIPGESHETHVRAHYECIQAEVNHG